MRIFFFISVFTTLTLLFACNPNSSPAGVEITPPDEVTLRDPIPVTDLPTVITDYVATNYPNETIISAEIETENDGTTSYEVTLSSGRELEFDANGNLLPDDDGDDDHDDDDDDDADHIARADLPAGILNYLNDNYPTFAFEEAERDTLCDLVPLISVELEDTTTTGQDREVELAFTETGEFVFLQEEVLTNTLPAAVTTALAAAYPNHTLDTEVDQLTAADGSVRYLVEMDNNQAGGVDINVLVLADGTVVCDEPEDD